MRKAKIIASTILVFAMLLFVVSCGKKANQADNGSAEKETASTQPSAEVAVENEEKKTDEKILLGYAALDDSQQHLIPVRENIKKIAAEKGVDVICVDNAGDGNKAVSNVDSLLLQGIDALIEFNLDASVNPVIKEKCDAAGVPVIGVDIPVPDAPNFGANNSEAGLICGRNLGELANENWDGQVDLVLLMDTPSAGEVVAIRMKSIVEGIKEKCPDFDEKNVVSVDFKDDAILAQQLAADVLTANPDKKHILVGSINDIGAQGAFSAIQSANRDEDCFIINHGMSVQTRENLYETLKSGKDNCWRGGVSYFLERYGEYVVPAAISMAKGEEVPENIYMDHVYVDKTNIEEYYPQSQWGQ